MSQSTQVSSPIPWRSIADHMWAGKTIQEACELIRIDYKDVRWHLAVQPKIMSMLLDTSMLASAREEILNASNTTNN